MVKHTQTLVIWQPTNCLIVFDHFVGLVLKVLEEKFDNYHSADYFPYRISIRYSFTSFKGCLPQILLVPFLNTLSQMSSKFFFIYVFNAKTQYSILLKKSFLKDCLWQQHLLPGNHFIEWRNIQPMKTNQHCGTFRILPAFCFQKLKPFSIWKSIVYILTLISFIFNGGWRCRERECKFVRLVTIMQIFWDN